MHGAGRIPDHDVAADAAAWMPKNPSRPTTMRASIGTMPWSGCWRELQRPGERKQVAEGGHEREHTYQQRAVIASSVMRNASRSCLVTAAP